ncbi:hypothetical protein [Rhabdochlamydiaceae symbiont of Dictyostelium giganteum]|uniref:hypothetical protein n=1 Tax=Rhabdochlamydiaceae symbiont of Dictyostelium giganteum TaxID=3342349 RepID=UPI003850174D
MQYREKSRLYFEVPVHLHHALNQCAVDLGITAQELVTQAILEKLHSLEYEQDSRDAVIAYERFLKNGSQTISHEEMMKRLEWEDILDE